MKTNTASICWYRRSLWARLHALPQLDNGSATANFSTFNQRIALAERKPPAEANGGATRRLLRKHRLVIWRGSNADGGSKGRRQQQPLCRDELEEPVPWACENYGTMDDTGRSSTGITCSFVNSDISLKL
jgi:hypothetical protein